MSRRASEAVVWTAAMAAVLVLVVIAVFNLVLTSSFDARMDSAWILAWVGFPVAGAIIASRRPDTPLGWLLVWIGVALAFMLGTSAFREWSVTVDGPAMPMSAFVAGQAAFVTALASVPLVILLFPSGHLPSPGMRLPVAVGLTAVGLLTLCYLFRGFVELGEGARAANPLAIEGLSGVIEAVIPVLGVAIAVLSVATVVNAVVRFRRSRGTERQQMKWFVSAAAAFPVLFAAGLAVDPFSRPLSTTLAMAAFLAGFNGMAAGIAIAVLRHRLYEIDRILSRTFAYALVAAVLGSVYVLLVVGLQRLTQAFTGGGDLAVAASTVVVGTAFQPVRRRIQAAVDRRFNRTRYDADQTVQEFAARLRDELDLTTLTEELKDVTRRTVRPIYLSVWLREP